MKLQRFELDDTPPAAGAVRVLRSRRRADGRGLHSSMYQLN
jgi:hypothetical protein